MPATANAEAPKIKKQISDEDALRHRFDQETQLLLAVFRLEPLDSTRSIHVFLRARKKGMAFGANADANVFLRGLRADHIAARAMDHRVHVLGMNFRFHVKTPARFKGRKP